MSVFISAKISTWLFLGFSLASCASGPCRQIIAPDLANRQVEGAKNPASEKDSMTVAKASDPAPKTVLVYQPDGSLQCGMGKKVAPEAMEKKLLGGIKVFSRDNRSDGLMRIQVCGSPTGMINVFEISETDLQEALKRGFKKFESR